MLYSADVADDAMKAINSDLIRARRESLARKVQALRDEIEALVAEDAKLGELEEAVEMYGVEMEAFGPLIPVHGSIGNNAGRVPGVSDYDPALDGSVPDPLVENILLKAGRPLHREELVEQLQQCGFPVPPAQPGAWLGMRLKRNARFVNFPKNGWWLKGLAYQPLGYVPPAIDPD